MESGFDSLSPSMKIFSGPSNTKLAENISNYIGINLGKSKITALKDAPRDYSGSIKILWDHADFFVINVSSPNTEGLRDLQQPKYLDSIFEK